MAKKRTKVHVTDDPAMKDKLSDARDALEANLKKLLRKQVPGASRSYWKALVQVCPRISRTSAMRYVGELQANYGFPSLAVLIDMAEAFKVSLFELLEGVHEKQGQAAPPAASSSSTTSSGSGGGIPGNGTHREKVTHLPVSPRPPRHADSPLEPELA
jgi:hypothetical protein